MKKDSVKARRKNFIWYLLTIVIIDLIQAIQLGLIRSLNLITGRVCKNDRACVFGRKPGFPIAVAFLVIKFLTHIYLMLVLKQHWLNKRDGRGDAKNVKNKEIPEYLLTQ